MKNRLFLTAFLMLLIVSCVPAKKYYEMEASYNKDRNRHQQDSISIVELRKVNGINTMRLMNLSKDSIRMNYAYDSLSILYQQATQSGSIQIANIKRQLEDKSVEVSQKEQRSIGIVAAFKSFDLEANAIYRRLSRFLQRYEPQGVKVINSLWTVSVSLPDEVLFDSGDFGKLSGSGERIIAAVAALVNENPRFFMEIAEFSKARKQSIATDSVSTYHSNEKIVVTVPNPDTLGKMDSIIANYELERFTVNKRNIAINIPPAMTRGGAVVFFIESSGRVSHNNLEYSGTIVTKRHKDSRKQVSENRVEIIISPKISSLLREIGAI